MVFNDQLGLWICKLTVYRTSSPVELGTPVERRGAESSTSGVNRVACLVILEMVPRMRDGSSGRRRLRAIEVNGIGKDFEKRKIKKRFVRLKHSSYKRYVPVPVLPAPSCSCSLMTSCCPLGPSLPLNPPLLLPSFTMVLFNFYYTGRDINIKAITWSYFQDIAGCSESHNPSTYLFSNSNLTTTLHTITSIFVQF
jgi:hypothetical protein